MSEFVNNYLGYLLARASHTVSSDFHQQLKARGVSVLTWRVLASIYEQTITVNALAATVLVKQSTLSKALDRLERDGFISRERDKIKRSRIRISITSKGKKLVTPLLKIANDYEKKSVDGLTNNQVKQLRNLLNKLLADK